MTIDYDKYANKNLRELVNCLSAAEKKYSKLQVEIKDKIEAQKDLIIYLKSKIRETMDSPYDFVPLEKSGLKEGIARVEAKLTEKDKKEIHSEVERACYGENQSDEL